MHYHLKFINSREKTVRELNVEADNDDSAICYSHKQSFHFDMAVELWRENEVVSRTTPKRARLNLHNPAGFSIERRAFSTPPHVAPMTIPADRCAAPSAKGRSKGAKPVTQQDEFR